MLEALPTALGIAAVAPGLLILWLVIATDKRPEPPTLIWATFLLGVAGIFALRYVRAPFDPLWRTLDDPWLAVGSRALFAAATPEELVKIGVIAVFAARLRKFAEPIDGVVYGAAAGLGFAAYENLVYLVAYADNWRAVAVVRDVMTVPFHAALGVIAGAYIASARFGGALGAHQHKRWPHARIIARAFAIPIALHALYDFPLLALRYEIVAGVTARRLLLLVGPAVFLVTVAIAVRLVIRIARHQHANARTHAPAAAWRAIWLLLMLGGGAGFAGAGLIVSALRPWWAQQAINYAALAGGVALLALAAGAYEWGRQHLVRHP